ncbi:MAG: DUF503 domain-containing protein [Planctomycetota bacterium]|nr:DUF503 domain-containing protein [Planctomycetota bacterium]
MKVGIIRADLQVPGSRSLKEKRHVLRSLKDRLVSRFEVSVAEVDHQDKLQRTMIGVSFVASDGKNAESRMQQIVTFIEGFTGAMVISIDKEILHENH